VKFSIDIDHERVHKFLVKYCIQVNSYKYGDGVNLLRLLDYVRQI
jgi:hypothetical protein